MNVKFVCLANSRKLGGRCVAGLRTDGSGWIRPVSVLPDGTLFEQHYILSDGSETSLLDIVEVCVSSHKPEPNQPENWVLLEKQKWQRLGRIESKEAYELLKPYLTAQSNLFGNTSDNIPFSKGQVNVMPASLAIIEPSNVSWYIDYYGDTRKTHALFKLYGVSYNLRITDPHWELRLGGLGVGTHSRDAGKIGENDKLLFTISLGIPFGGKCYKLVAGIIHLPN